MAKIEELKKDQNAEEQQEQTPKKKESFLKRTFKRFGRDLLDIGIGFGIGAAVVGSVFMARSGKAAEGTASEAEDQETEEKEEDSLEISDE